jgi:hypothetical protein
MRRDRDSAPSQQQWHALPEGFATCVGLWLLLQGSWLWWGSTRNGFAVILAFLLTAAVPITMLLLAAHSWRDSRLRAYGLLVGFGILIATMYWFVQQFGRMGD